MQLPKSILLTALVLTSLSALAYGGLTEAGEACLGGAQVTVLRLGEPVSLGSYFDTYGKLYLAPEPTCLAPLLFFFLLGRRNR